MRALWITLVASFAGGCLDEIPPEDPTMVASRGACTALEGLQFHSLQPGECGLTPDGVGSCTWHITFEAYDGSTKSRFTWSHSDVGESGYVTCDGSAIHSVDSTFGYQGSFNDAQLDLIWDDRAYAP